MSCLVHHLNQLKSFPVTMIPICVETVYCGVIPFCFLFSLFWPFLLLHSLFPPKGQHLKITNITTIFLCIMVDMKLLRVVVIFATAHD